MAVIQVIQTGSTLVSPAVPDRSTRKAEFAYTGIFQKRKNRISVPVKAFLIKVSGHTILIDTGWSEECVTHPIRHLGFALWFASEPVMKQGESAAEQIKGTKPDAVLLTHLDCDHASGLESFRKVKKIYVSEQEVDDRNTRGVRYNRSFWKDISFTYYPMKPDPQAPFGQSADIFNDGTVIAYYTPSHSAGSVAIKVSDHGRFAIFTGDNGYNRKSWEELKLPGPIYNKENMKTALAWVREQSKDPACTGIYAAHDPEVNPGTYTF